MNLKIIGFLVIAVGIVILIGIFGLEFITDKNEDDIFHVILADSTMYQNGVFTDSFEIGQGKYYYEFVPNGDSPKTLTISLLGQSHQSTETFSLNSESHETGISQYYTWEYVGDGESTIEVSSPQQVQITINPHENYNGPVSVFLKKLL